jgi:hypothetical protein
MQRIDGENKNFGAAVLRFLEWQRQNRWEGRKYTDGGLV